VRRGLRRLTHTKDATIAVNTQGNTPQFANALAARATQETVEMNSPDPSVDEKAHSASAGRLGVGGKQAPTSKLRSLGLGLITGAADDDPSAIGTYAAAGASLGPSFLWTAPLSFPMMFAVVYLCSKIGQVTGQGLFSVIK
jgi:hypothetical protein